MDGAPVGGRGERQADRLAAGSEPLTRWGIMRVVACTRRVTPSIAVGAIVELSGGMNSTPHLYQMKLFSAIATTVVISIAIISTTSEARARPLRAPHSGTCSFNGVKELCVAEWDTDGTLNVTYLSDGKRVSYQFLHDGKGKVYDGNRAYNAAVSNRGDHYIFTTQNGQTVVPAY